MLPGSLTGSLMAFLWTRSVSHGIHRWDLLRGGGQPLSAVLGPFEDARSRVGNSSCFWVRGHGEFKNLFLIRESTKRRNLSLTVLWSFPVRACSLPPFCPCCGSRMQRASLQHQPITAQRRTAGYNALLLPNAIQRGFYTLVEVRCSIHCLV